MTTTEQHPYAAAASIYTSAGWAGILPVRDPLTGRLTKHPPPVGFTGRDGTDPTPQQVRAWAEGPPGNVGLRLPPGFIGIDVDDYDGKNGGLTLQSLEARWGPLPATWISTSRYDGRSGIRIFRLRESLPVNDKPGPGIEVIQHHHRFVVCWPSVHPDTGDIYRWIDANGSVEGPPTPADIPLVPEKWENGLRGPKERPTVPLPPPVDRGGRWTKAVEDAYGRAMADMSGGRHDAALHGSAGLIRLLNLGYPGADEALARLEDAFLSTVTADGTRTEREAEREWTRMIEGAKDLVASTSSIVRPYADLIADRENDDIIINPPKGAKRDLPPAGEAPAGNWDEPVPLGSMEDRLPVFPVDIFPGWITDMVRAVAGELQVPVDLPAMLALGALSTLAATRVKVLVGGNWLEAVNLYLVAAMPPGSGKSPASKIMLRPVYDYESELMERARPAFARYEQEQRMLDKAMKRAEDQGDRMAAADLLMQKETMERAVIPQLITEDTTPAALIGILADNGNRVAVLSTEGTLFDTLATERFNSSAAEQYGLYLKGFSGDAHRENRVTRGRNDIDEVTLTVCLTVQPAVLEKLAGRPELAGVGLTARFAYALPPNLVGFRNFLNAQPVPPEVADVYRRNLLTLAHDLDRHQIARRLHLSPEAAGLFHRWHQDLEPRRREGRDLHGVAEWTEKLRVMVVRVAGLLHLAEGHDWDEIDADTMRRALRVADFWLYHAKALHSMWAGEQADRTADRILKWIIKGRRARFTARDCYRDLHLRATALRPAMELLADFGWVRQVGGEWGKGKGEAPRYRSHVSLVQDATSVDSTVTLGSEAPGTPDSERVADESPSPDVTATNPDLSPSPPEDPEINRGEGQSHVVTGVSKDISDISLSVSDLPHISECEPDPVTTVTPPPRRPYVPDPNARPDVF